jgi:hypothetical protein
MGTRNLRLLAVGAAASALALGSVGTASAALLPDTLLGGLTNTVGNVVGTVVPAVTAPIVGQGGLLDNTVVVARANVDVPNVAHVDTDTAVVINDGKIVAATDTHANVLNVVKADVTGVAVVDTQRPSVFVFVPEAHANVAGITVDAFVAPTTVDLRKLTVKAPLIAARVQAGDIKVKAKASAFVNLRKGKVFVKAKAKAKIGHTTIKARAKVKVKLHHGLKAKAFIRATVR